MNVNDKLIIEALAASKCGEEVFNTKETNKFIMNIASRSIDLGSNPLNAIKNMGAKPKESIIKTLCSAKLLPPCHMYSGTVPHGFRYKTTPNCSVKAFPRPNEDRKALFKFDVPIDVLSTYNGLQFLRIITNPPKLSSKYGDQYKDQDGNLLSGVKFRYTKKPGIRAIREIRAMSNSIEYETYTQLDALRYDYEAVSENTWGAWNELIGHDLGREAAVYNPFLETDTVVSVKSGNQTPLHDKPGLELHIPLLLDTGRDFASKLNITGILPDTLTIEGTLEYSHLMVKAEFYDDDITVPPIQLDCEPLEICDFTLITEVFYVDDYLHEAVNGLNQSVFVRNWDSVVNCIADRDPCDLIRITGNANTEAYTICTRPKSYRDDFDMWTNLTEVEKFCTPTCIVTPSAPGVFNNVAIAPAVSYIPVKSLEELRLFGGEGYELKPLLPTTFYGVMEHYKLARNHPNYRPRNLELCKFNFNYFYMGEYLTGALPQGKLDPVELHLRFNSRHLDNNSLLLQDWEVITFRDTFNKRVMKDSNLVLRYQP